jgi:hypothetical protein
VEYAMTHSRKFVATLACCVATWAALVGHASAEQIFEERYHDEGSHQYEDFCAAGLNVGVEYVIDGKVKAVQRGPDGFAYFLEHLTETEVYTNLANGKTVTYVFKGKKQDLKTTDNGDGTLTILGQLTGTDLLYGADGKVIARSAGVSRNEFLIDHGGTPTDPFDDEFIADLGQVKRAGRSDDLCAAFVAAIT